MLQKLGAKIIFLVVIFVLLLVITLLIKESLLYKQWIKLLIILYYTLITVIFIVGYHRISTTYNMYDGPVIHEGWEVKSKWASWFSFAFVLPLGALMVYTIFRK